jgi:hypothetical protein
LGRCYPSRNRSVQQVIRLVMGAKQAFDAVPQTGVVRTFAVEQGSTLGSGRLGHGGGENALGAIGDCGHASVLLRMSLLIDKRPFRAARLADLEN